MEHSPQYWKTFYKIQAVLIEESPEKYTSEKTSGTLLNIRAHAITKAIHENYV